MNLSFDNLAALAVAHGMPASASADEAENMRREITRALESTWQPPPSSDGGRPRTPFHLLVRSAVRNAGHHSRNVRKERWQHVMDALGVGSTFAKELCVWAGVDPDQLMGSWQR